MQIKQEKKNDTTLIHVKTDCGMEVVFSTFGASFYDLKTFDKNKKLESIVLTPTKYEDFCFSDGYYGKSVGRYSGRIDNSVCTINGVEYKLDRNWNGVNALHGGFEGISFQNFDYEINEEEEYADIVFTFLEKENQLPGDVFYTITYRVMNKESDINITFEATTTKDTIVNLTNHIYFNLSGNGVRNCLDHKIQFLCDKYTKLNNNLITETIEKVNDVMDFRDMHKLGKYIYDESLQNHKAKGYDHCFIKEDLNNPKVAVLVDEESGRRVSVESSYPAIVCYAGCYPGSFGFNKEGFKIGQYHSVCLECQYIPNGINMDGVCKAILKKGEKYSHYIKYHFDLV